VGAIILCSGLLILLYPLNKVIIGAIRFGLVVDYNKLTYRGFWKTKRKEFIFDDISYFVKKTNSTRHLTVDKYYAYSKDNKKLFGITSMLSCYDIFLKVITEREIEVRYK